MYRINLTQYNQIHYKYSGIYICRNLKDLNKKPNDPQRTTVSLDISVYNRLKDKGTFGDSFSDVIARILNELDSTQREANEQ